MADYDSEEQLWQHNYPDVLGDRDCRGRQRPRKAVGACERHLRGTRVPRTISCGMSDFCEGDWAEQRFARAVAAPRNAKESGRNPCRSA